MKIRALVCVAGLAAMCMARHAAYGQNLPDGFLLEEVASGFQEPVAVAFAGDGRAFVAEKRGVIRVVENGNVSPEPFLDIENEVDDTGFRGLLGIALDPDFLMNHRVYICYSVVPPGEPSGAQYDPTFGRVTQYTGTSESGGNVADPDSRHVLIGGEPSSGILICWAHIVDTLRFGADGSLLVSIGDGANFSFADAGGSDPDCFQPPLFDSDLDIGAFRAQYIGSMNGKVLRIDPQTGNGLPDNPYWNGEQSSPQSRVWVSGLRNPFRFCVRPGTGSSSFPGVLYIGDVGWDHFEEINISRFGGENFGWPCYEGVDPAPNYPSLNPAHSGCETIKMPENPGPLVHPNVLIHNNNPKESFPDPITGRTVIGGDFYTGDSYPLAYRDAYFFADWVENWIHILRVDGLDAYVNSFPFAESIEELVEIVADPVSGDLHIVSRNPGTIYRLRYDGPASADLDGNGVVNVFDLLQLLGAWGECSGGPPQCPEDIDGNGVVNVFDVLLLVAVWGS